MSGIARESFSEFLFVHVGGIGNWTTVGCNTIDFNDTTGLVTCECDHLTNFGVLVVSHKCRTYQLKCDKC